jgi:glycosyltransferase involved in cell wall biosynthesis
MKDISAVIIVKDAQRTITQCLSSLTDFSEVILYDTGSTDKTCQLAKNFPNVQIVEGKFVGFGPTKNRAIQYATNDWIFSLDADEVISQQLLSSLKELTLQKETLYIVERINFYRQQPITHCWGADFLVRLFNRQESHFNDNLVHEDIVRSGQTEQTLSGHLLHYPYADLSAFIQKFDIYSTQFALANQGKRHSSPTHAFANALFSFFKTYILKRGFLDGYPGLVIAFSHAATNFYKYMKLYELNQ